MSKWHWLQSRSFSFQDGGVKAQLDGQDVRLQREDRTKSMLDHTEKRPRDYLQVVEFLPANCQRECPDDQSPESVQNVSVNNLVKLECFVIFLIKMCLSSLRNKSISFNYKNRNLSGFEMCTL